LYSEKDRNYKLKLKTLEEKIKFDKDDQEEKSKKIQKASKNNVELKSKAEAQTLIEKDKSYYFFDIFEAYKTVSK